MDVEIAPKTDILDNADRMKRHCSLIKRKIFLTHELVKKYNDKIKECEQVEADLEQMNKESKKLTEGYIAAFTRSVKLEASIQNYKQQIESLSNTVREHETTIAGHEKHVKQLSCKIKNVEEEYMGKIMQLDLEKLSLKEQVRKLQGELKVLPKNPVKKQQRITKNNAATSPVREIKPGIDIGVNTVCDRVVTDIGTMTDELGSTNKDVLFPLFCNKCESVIESPCKKICNLMSQCPPFIEEVSSPSKSYNETLRSTVRTLAEDEDHFNDRQNCKLKNLGELSVITDTISMHHNNHPASTSSVMETSTISSATSQEITRKINDSNHSVESMPPIPYFPLESRTILNEERTVSFAQRENTNDSTQAVVYLRKKMKRLEKMMKKQYRKTKRLSAKCVLQTPCVNCQINNILQQSFPLYLASRTSKKMKPHKLRKMFVHTDRNDETDFRKKLKTNPKTNSGRGKLRSFSRNNLKRRSEVSTTVDHSRKILTLKRNGEYIRKSALSVVNDLSDNVSDEDTTFKKKRRKMADEEECFIDNMNDNENDENSTARKRRRKICKKEFLINNMSGSESNEDFAVKQNMQDRRYKVEDQEDSFIKHVSDNESDEDFTVRKRRCTIRNHKKPFIDNTSDNEDEKECTDIKKQYKVDDEEKFSAKNTNDIESSKGTTNGQYKINNQEDLFSGDMSDNGSDVNSTTKEELCKVDDREKESLINNVSDKKNDKESTVKMKLFNADGAEPSISSATGNESNEGLITITELCKSDDQKEFSVKSVNIEEGNEDSTGKKKPCTAGDYKSPLTKNRNVQVDDQKKLFVNSTNKNNKDLTNTNTRRKINNQEDLFGSDMSDDGSYGNFTAKKELYKINDREEESFINDVSDEKNDEETAVRKQLSNVDDQEELFMNGTRGNESIKNYVTVTNLRKLHDQEEHITNSVNDSEKHEDSILRNKVFSIDINNVTGNEENERKVYDQDEQRDKEMTTTNARVCTEKEIDKTFNDALTHSKSLKCVSMDSSEKTDVTLSRLHFIPIKGISMLMQPKYNSSLQKKSVIQLNTANNNKVPIENKFSSQEIADKMQESNIQKYFYDDTDSSLKQMQFVPVSKMDTEQVNSSVSTTNDKVSIGNEFKEQILQEMDNKLHEEGIQIYSRDKDSSFMGLQHTVLPKTELQQAKSPTSTVSNKTFVEAVFKKKNPQEIKNKMCDKDTLKCVHNGNTSFDQTQRAPSLKVETEEETMLVDAVSRDASKTSIPISLLQTHLKRSFEEGRNSKEKLNVAEQCDLADKFVKRQLCRLLENNNWNETLQRSVIDNLTTACGTCGVRIIAKNIVELLCEKATTREALDKTFTPPAPLMTKTQQKITTLLIDLEEKVPKVTEFVQIGIKYKLFRLNKTPQKFVIENLVRVYVVLARIKKDREQVRILCCDAVYCLGLTAAIVIYTALTCWPEVLPKRNETTEILPQCVAHITSSRKATDLSQLNVLRSLLVRYYNYEPGEYRGNRLLDVLLSLLREKYQNGLNTAIILFAKKEGTSWTYENLVQKGLLPMIVNHKHPSMYQAFRLLGFLLRAFPIRDPNHSVEKIVEQLTDLLESGEGSAEQQEGIASALLSLSRHQPEKVLASIMKWNRNEALQPITTRQYLAYFRSKTPRYWSQYLKNTITLIEANKHS